MMDSLGPQEWTAIMLSLRVALIATLAALPVAIWVAYILARKSFPGRQVLNGIVHLPLVLPPVVTGYLLLVLFGQHVVAGIKPAGGAYITRQFALIVGAELKDLNDEIALMVG